MNFSSIIRKVYSLLNKVFVYNKYELNMKFFCKTSRQTVFNKVFKKETVLKDQLWKVMITNCFYKTDWELIIV